MSNRVIFASENTRFYDPKTNEAISEVVGANGKTRNPTIADARKNGWLPSITNILRVLDAPELDAYKAEKCIRAALDTKQNDGETEEDYIKRLYMISKEEGSLAAERGKDFHAAFEDFFVHDKESADPVIAKAITGIQQNLGAIETIYGQVNVQEFEKPFCNAKVGVAGRCDLQVIANDTVIFIDFKGCDLTKFKKPYFKYGLQLAGYDVGISPELKDPFRDILYSNWMFDRNTGEVKCFWWGDDMEHTREQLIKGFLAAKELWCCQNKYWTGGEQCPSDSSAT